MPAPLRFSEALRALLHPGPAPNPWADDLRRTARLLDQARHRAYRFLVAGLLIGAVGIGVMGRWFPAARTCQKCGVTCCVS